MGRFHFTALSQTDFQWDSGPPHPIKYNNGLCHQFIAADIDILFEIQCREVTLHDITCYWSEKQPTFHRIQLVHISPRRRN